MIDAAEKTENDGGTMFIVDAALLIEAGFNEFFNSILLITADKSIRFNRILIRKNIPENQIVKRMALQLPESEKRKWAHTTIENNGTICYQQNNNLHSIQAKNIIIATGSIERPFPIEGWTLPGVMTVGAAQILMKNSGLVDGLKLRIQFY